MKKTTRASDFSNPHLLQLIPNPAPIPFSTDTIIYGAIHQKEMRGYIRLKNNSFGEWSLYLLPVTIVVFADTIAKKQRKIS